MIRQILRSSKFRRELYKNKLVCGCLYRSFNDLEAGIFFRFAMNGGTLSKQQILDMIDRTAYSQNQQKFLSIIDSFQKLQIIQGVRTFDTITYKLNQEFVTNIQAFIKEKTILQPVNMDKQKRIKKQQPQPFEFLQILFNNKLPRRCKISGVYNQAPYLTKQQFVYIKSDISYKIGILIDGIINQRQSDNVRNIQNLIMLNLLDSQQFYLRNERINPMLDELQKIKLVQIVGQQKQYFRISKYLQHFTFKDAKDKQIDTKLNCSIIIQTNFKVFATIQSQQPRENIVIKRILSMLLKSDREGIVCEKLFIGEITVDFMKNIVFNKTMITTSEYFDFFKQYTDQGHSLQKDLGKWKKLKFIGLEGPSEDSNIPSNIRQQVKLWQHLKDYKDQ